MLQEVIDDALLGNRWEFIPDGLSEEELEGVHIPDINEIRYDVQITDEEGNIYQIQDGKSTVTYKNCKHAYVQGTVNEHVPKSDGGAL